YSALHEQAVLLGELGIEYEVVPGVSSFQAAAAVLKRELTVPQVSQTVILTRLEGRTPVPEGEKLEKLARSGATLCVFLSAGMIDRVVEAAAAHYPWTTPAAVVYRASWPDQQVVTGSLADIAGKAKAAMMERQSMILIGRALGAHAARSNLYHRGFGHGFREKAP
ncbi:MAG: cobalt-precorrin-4/precorrin-4 C(11)-methyltransferase, partial [Spirochaetota bacterium]